MTSTSKKYKVIGTRPIRHDGVDKVTGTANYGSDIKLKGMLYGKVLRSPHPHARIKKIDTSNVFKLEGVKAVVTHDDFPTIEDRVEHSGETVVSSKRLADNLLASAKVLYKGHAIAAVAAVNQHIAEEALSLIDVEYEILPFVVDIREAMKEDAPLLHEDLYTNEFGASADKPSNIADHSQDIIGDIDKGFADADVIVEREFTTAMVHQGYIEPHNGTARWEPDGRLSVWCSSQGHFAVRSQTASLMAIPASKVKVYPMEIGGGFGGKTTVYLEPVAALLSKKTGGLPVKMYMKRDEVFEGSGPAPGSYCKVKMGATKDGKIVAGKAIVAMEAGGYPGSAVGAGVECIFGPYEIENIQIDGYDVVVNRPKSCAYRAPGAPQVAFAAENVVNELADKLGIDPLEFRLNNAAKKGSIRRDGKVLNVVIGCEETVLAAKNHAHYKSPLPGKNRGRGVASGYWMNGGGPSSCTLTLVEDGTVKLIEGSPDIGGSRASIAMQAAEVLDIKAEEVLPQVGDTDSVGFTGTTGGSRVTYATGLAAYEAANELKQKLIGEVADIWDISSNEVKYEDGVFSGKNGDKMTFKELAKEIGGLVSASASVSPSGEGKAFATHIVDVEVDPETGKVTILRYTAVQDVGTAIHPAYVENQIQGGVAQGIGWALNEEYYYDNKGVMNNSSFLDYRMPVALDLPMIECEIVEVENPGSPFGIRGVGEVPLAPPLAAIQDAIYNAVNVRLFDTPMNPARIVNALMNGH